MAEPPGEARTAIKPRKYTSVRHAVRRGYFIKIHAPLLGNFGDLNRGITPDDAHSFEKSMKTLHKSVDVKIYADAGHAFENPTNKTGDRPADAADAWTRMTVFLRENSK